MNSDREVAPKKRAAGHPHYYPTTTLCAVAAPPGTIIAAVSRAWLLACSPVMTTGVSAANPRTMPRGGCRRYGHWGGVPRQGRCSGRADGKAVCGVQGRVGGEGHGQGGRGRQLPTKQFRR